MRLIFCLKFKNKRITIPASAEEQLKFSIKEQIIAVVNVM